jgi:deoxyribonuclease V
MPLTVADAQRWIASRSAGDFILHLPAREKGSKAGIHSSPMQIDFSWQGTTAPWKAEQQRVRELVRIESLGPLPRFVAGVDCAFSSDGKIIRAAAVVYDREAKTIIEQTTLDLPCLAPYVPTYLSFREAPAILAVIERLKHPYGALLFDGQGLAHPRRCGLATHVGVLLDVPSVGVAKSRLIGTHAEPAVEAGSRVDLLDKSDVIGTVLRNRANVKPLYVSVGHRMDLESAAALVQACTTRYRLPEPTRVADKLSKFGKKGLGSGV